VVDVTGPVPLLLREGALSRAQMEQVVHVAHP
jgi:tRNA A37 threonylcarbamoyladenosine synthetase subunit TsaC/SUA5/YrdC